MGLAKKAVKGKNHSKAVLIFIGVMLVVLGGVLFYGNIKMKQECVQVPAVISRIGTGKHKNRVYAEYTYNDTVYEQVLNYGNTFTMKENKPITVYIDPVRPDLPKVPAYGICILVTAMGIAAVKVGLSVKPQKEE